MNGQNKLIFIFGILIIVLYVSCFKSEQDKIKSEIIEKVSYLGSVNDEKEHQIVDDIVALIHAYGPKGLTFIERALYDGSDVKRERALVVISKIPFDESIQVLIKLVDSIHDPDEKRTVLITASGFHQTPAVLELGIYMMKDNNQDLSKFSYDWMISKVIKNKPKNIKPEIWANTDGNVIQPSYEKRQEIVEKWEKWYETNKGFLVYNSNKGIIDKRTRSDSSALRCLKQKVGESESN